MSQFGAEFIGQVGRYLATEDDVPELGFKENGYLFLVSEAQEAMARAGQELQCSLGAKSKISLSRRLGLRFSLAQS